MLARLPDSMPRLAEQCALWLHHRRMPALAAGSCAAAVVLVIALFARSESPVPLFDAPLHPRQAAEVEQALILWNEPFHADAGGTQVFVEGRRRRDVLLRLSLAGIPHRYAPTTADMLDTPTNLLTPPEVFDERRRAGIEGDLVAGLRRIDGVADATVVIAPAGGDAFASESDRSPPSASVQLILEPNGQLSASTVAGIRRFVAAGYPGLAPDRVAVVDGSGALLGTPPDRTVSREVRIQTNVQTALDAVLGPGAAVVRVSVRNAGAVETVQSTRVVPHGLLDADVGRETGSENGRHLSKERSTRHYAYDTIVEHRTTAADEPAKVSVAVFLDAARVDVERSQPIAALVRAAAGAYLSAGDAVVVELVRFAPKPVALAPQTPMPVALAVLPVAGVVLAVALGLHFFPQRARPPDPAVREIRASLERESPRTAAYVLSTLPRGMRERVLASYGPIRRAPIEACLRRDR